MEARVLLIILNGLQKRQYLFTAVSVYFTSKQILPFGFGEQTAAPRYAINTDK